MSVIFNDFVGVGGMRKSADSAVAREREVD